MTIRLGGGILLEGLVTFQGVPLPHHPFVFRIEDGTKRELQSDAEGWYRINSVSPGEAQLTTRADLGAQDSYYLSVPLALEGSGTVRVDLAMAPGATAIEGTILAEDECDKFFIKARSTLSNGEEHVSSVPLAAARTYRLEGLPEGPAVVTAAARCKALKGEMEQDIALVPGVTAEADFDFGRPTRVAGTVAGLSAVEENGVMVVPGTVAPPSDFSDFLMWNTEHDEAIRARLGEHGEFEAVLPRPGSYTLVACSFNYTSKEFRSVAVPFEAHQGETTEIDCAL